jgi:hypothetical protein
MKQQRTSISARDMSGRLNIGSRPARHEAGYRVATASAALDCRMGRFGDGSKL